MSNLGEEEIILLQDFINGEIEVDKLENYKGGYKMGYFYTKDLQKAIQGLLDLYNKEKEKNKELEEMKDTAENELQSTIKELEKLQYERDKYFDLYNLYSDKCNSSEKEAVEILIECCKNTECEKCKYYWNETLCGLHNPRGWEGVKDE